MKEYRLHYFPESGNSYKLALMLTLCAKKFEPVWTDFGSRITWTPEWRSLNNAMGEIPVLEENGQKLTQTGPLLIKMSKEFGQFGATNEQEEFEILRWLFWDNQKLSGYMASYRFLRTFTEHSNKDVLIFLRRRIDDFLSVLEAQVSAQQFVIGNRATIVDISMCAYLSYPSDETGYDLAASHPKVNEWLGRIAALPNWQYQYDLLPGKRLQRYA
jgi:glutathione S-transferase